MNSHIILFIHGLGGDPARTWGKFPDLVRADEELGQSDIGFFSYPTSLFRLPFTRKAPRIQTLAKGLRTILERKFQAYDQITLVCHSLGGLIARKYLLDEVESGRDLRVCQLLLFAVPNNGAGLASVAKHISWRHSQLAQLCRQSDLIADLNEDWFRHKMDKVVTVRYVVAALDRIVDEASAQAFWGNPAIDVVPNRGHLDIVKPTDIGDLSFLILKDFLRKKTPIGPNITDISKYETKSLSRFSFRKGKQELRKTGHQIVGFDLDGTLLRGLEFSWTLVWDYLNFPISVRKEGMRRYLAGETTYEVWCEWACRQFRQKGLKHSDFKEITKSLTLTRNLHEALNILRNDGVLLAIVSGG
jgi:pimeloyl-ACP methyl ester carboxylesterase